MSKKQIAIVCDGKEISFGTNLLHLFSATNNQNTVFSSLGSQISVDIYSPAVFKRTGVSKKAIKVYINDQNVDSSFVEIYNKYGMIILKSETEYVLKVFNATMDNAEYNSFIEYANLKRKEYLDNEKQYVIQTEELCPGWIVSKFSSEKKRSLFEKNNLYTQQKYDCMAFVLYMDYLMNR